MNSQQIVYQPQEFFTIEEAGKVLNLGKRTISEYLKKGTLRCSRINRQVVRISRADLADFMARHSTVQA